MGTVGIHFWQILIFQFAASFVLHIVMSPHDLKIFRRECTTSALANQIFLLCRSYFIVFYSRASRNPWLNRSWLNICLWKELFSIWSFDKFLTTNSICHYSVVSCYCFCAGRYFILYCIALVSLFGAYDWTLSSTRGKFIYVINKSFYIEERRK